MLAIPGSSVAPAAGVYRIENTVTGKGYIGSASNMRRRLREHYLSLQRGDHHSRYLQRSWRKYGASAFKFEPILVCAPEDLLFYEQLAIDGFGTAQPRGFNICPVAGSLLGHKRDPEVVRSIALKRRGHRWTPEQRARLSLLRTGKPIPKLRGRPSWNKGVSPSAETREKLRAFNLGKKQSAETIAKKRKTHCKRGHPLTGDNIYFHPKDGKRACATCRADASTRHRQKARLAAGGAS